MTRRHPTRKERRVYARIATFEGGDDDRLRQINEERMNAGTMPTPEGMKRAVVLSDKQAGRRLFISFFDSAEGIKAAEQQFEKMGDEIPEDVRGRRTSVEVYEVVFEGDV
jgi:hypothetical protein